MGFKTMRRGIKEASAESVLTPRFYTTNFEAMEEMFSLEKNPGMRGSDSSQVILYSLARACRATAGRFGAAPLHHLSPDHLCVCAA